MLIAAGYEVESAADRNQALRTLGEEHVFKLVLIDLNLPHGHSGTTLGAVAHRRGVKVLYMMAFDVPPELNGSVVSKTHESTAALEGVREALLH